MSSIIWDLCVHQLFKARTDDSFGKGTRQGAPDKCGCRRTALGLSHLLYCDCFVLGTEVLDEALGCVDLPCNRLLSVCKAVPVSSSDVRSR